ncbi:MAG: Tfp pilus assembly protein tip-associated adhesin PilY1 [Gallionellaceae bacterium]|nr:MAG: Tfp pilus assembly protein tip-associated adhesin PilY1 [Gallionellaceae bacterium]
MPNFLLKPQKLQALCTVAFLGIAVAATGSALAVTAFAPANQPVGYVSQDEATNYNLTAGNETLFRTEYKRDYWGGNLFAYPVDAAGNVQAGADRWGNGAKDHIDAQNWDTGRLIATMKDDGTRVAFRPASLSVTQQASLAATTNGTAYTGADIVNFLRGDRSNEGSTSLRQRSTVLGDIIHSRPYFVNDEDNPTIFVGSNDGMLHAINATGAAPAPSAAESCSTSSIVSTSTSCSGVSTTTSTPITTCSKPLSSCASCGSEHWSYVPSMLIGKLKSLAYSPADAALPFAHDYFVDGQISIGNITISGASHRVLIGGLGSGGKGLYALDITGSAGLTAASEAEVANKILWEITPTAVNYATPTAHTSAATTVASAAAYSKLGYTYGKPTITRINYGGTAMDVVIIGNGYDDTAAGESYLYVINAATGALIRAIQAGASGAANPNGLSSPAVLDTNGDGYADRVYAGDLNGTLWKFDLSSTNVSSWSVSALLVTSPAQAITTTPGVGAHPNGGYMVSFGTGKVFAGAYGTYDHAASTWTSASTGDLGDSAVHYVYGVWDGAPASNAGVLWQTITERAYTINITVTTCSATGETIQTSVPSAATRVRRSTANAPNWASGGTKYWKVALPPGERVIGEGSFTENGRFYFIGYNPTVAPYQVSGTNTDIFGENWLMELNYLTGGSSTTPFLDMDSNLLLNDSDRIAYIASDTKPAGKVDGDRIVAGNDAFGNVVSRNEDGIPVGKWISSGTQSQPILVQLQTLNTTLFNQNPDVIFPPTTTVSRGVAGGHFDVDNFYGATNNCTNVAGAGSKAAGGRIDFTYSGNKTVSSFSITINGTNILTANNPGSQSRSNLESWVAANSSSADYDITVSSNRINIRAKNVGSAFNASTANMVVSGTGIASGDYSKTALSGGANETPPIYSSSSTVCTYVRHEHEYDDKYDKTGVNMLNASQSAYNLSNAIPSASTNFKVLMMNQYLSPAVSLHIGDSSYNPSSAAGYVSVKNYQAAAGFDIAAAPAYNRSTIGSLAVNMPVDAFSVKDWWGSGDQRVGLHSVKPQCAWSGSGSYADMYHGVTPPANGTDGPGTASDTGARHDGVLTIQIVKDTTPASAVEENVAGRPEYGYRVKHANFYDYVLVEYIFYWHHPRDMCYETSGTAWDQVNNDGNAWNTEALMTGNGWTKAPPEDNAVSTASSNPAAGSTDPKIGVLGSTGTVASTATTVVGNVTTTTITYTDGTSQTIVQTANNDGTVTIVITMYDAAGAVASTTTSTIANAAGAVKTGGDERGLQARTGRISWHELIRP